MATYRESFIVRIASDPVAMFWTGHGDLLVPADAVVPDEILIHGAGELTDLPDFQQLMNGTAERLEITLSGVSAEALRLAVEDAETVQGAAVNIGRINFDTDWQQLGDIEWEALFEARKLGVSRPPANDNDAERSITLTIASGETTRSRSQNAHFTDADQRRRPGSEDDAICDHVAALNQGASRRWGPK